MSLHQTKSPKNTQKSPRISKDNIKKKNHRGLKIEALTISDSNSISVNSLKLYLNEQKKICKKLENISLKVHKDKIHQISLNNLYKIFNKIDMNFPTKSDIPVAGHGLKNRYCSILPNPITRLKLPADESSQNQQLQTTDLILPNHDKFPENLPSEHLDTYINANWIRSWSWRTNYARDFCIIVSSCS